MTFIGTVCLLVPLISFAVFVNGESLRFCEEMLRNNWENQGSGPIDCRDVEGFYWCVLPEFFSSNPTDDQLMVPFIYLTQEFPDIHADLCSADFRAIADLRFGEAAATGPTPTEDYGNTGRPGGRSTDYYRHGNYSTDFYYGGVSTSTYDVYSPSTYVVDEMVSAGVAKRGHNIVVTLSLALMIVFTALTLN